MNKMMRKRFLPILFVISGLATPVYMIEPAAMIDGLAIYRTGTGEPVFLMPYPHASGGSSMAEHPLTDILTGLGRSVVTFDPPGLYHSTRKPSMELAEMLDCTLETLAYFGLVDSIDMMGHSMGSFCALAFAIEHQGRVKRLVLVGSTSGWPAVRKWGLPHNWKWWKDKEYWQCMYLGTRIALGRGNLEIHKRLDHLVASVSYVDPQYVPEPDIKEGDKHKPLPVRSDWFDHLRRTKVDYQGKLHLLDLPVLICVGKHDPQTPPVMNRQLHEGIANSELVVFDKSGHSPFIEEQEAFTRVLEVFMSRP
ncbi:MAG: alpha/beta hydrolase [Fidelibacterota bacterium]|nr:MAG: alpha/beta hydrolase [Candidatus Neomarinimicrobiota bacterium]